MDQMKIFSDVELEKRNTGLVEIKNILEHLGIQFMLFDGALLGAVRESNFIKWDWDVELALKVEDFFSNEKIICDALRKIGFTVSVTSPLFSNFKINAFKFNTKYSLIGFYEKDNLRMRDKWQYPKEFFENTQELNFLGHAYRCPSPPEKYLEFQYGDWRTPIKERRSNRYLSRQIYRSSEIHDYFYKIVESLKEVASQVFDPFLLRRQSKREENFLTMLESVPLENLNFIDVGSNDASESIYLLKKNATNFHCYIIEPDPNAFEKVQRRIRRLCPNKINDVKMFNMGISDTVGQKNIYIFSHDSHLNSLEKRHESQVGIPAWFTTLDKFIENENIKTPIFIKMDIEGHEVEVLKSLTESASTMKPIYILLEVHPNRYSENHSLQKTLEYYFDHGFKTTILETAGLVLPDLFKEKGYKPFKISKGLMSYPRGLYKNLPNDFVLKTACHEINNNIPQKPYVTTKIVRSILITNTDL